MKIDGIQLVQGSNISNLVVANGTAFPANADEGELFFRTDAALNVKGLYAYIGGTWDRVASSDSFTSPNGTTLPLEANAGDLFYLNTNDSNEGLYAYNGSAWVITSGGGSASYTVTGDVTGTIDGGTDVLTLATVATPGTYRSVTVNAKGLVTAGTNPTTLAGYGITDAQPLDADLTAIAALTGTSGFLKTDGASNWSVDTSTYLTGNQTITLSGDITGSGTTSIATSLLTIGTPGTWGSASSVPVFNTDTKGRVVAIGNTPIAIAASQTTSGTFADARIAQSSVTQHQAALSILESQITDGSLLARVGGNETITGSWQFNNPLVVATPSSGSHATTKDYVDQAISGLSWKNSVRAATIANITLSGTQTIDGVALVAGNRVLVKNQSTASENGVYVVAAGAWARATDFDSVSPIDEINSAAVFVQQGTTLADTAWTQTLSVATVGTDAIGFTQFAGTNTIFAGAGLALSGNTFNVGTASSSRIVVNVDDIDLATIGTPVTSSFVKVTTDAYGRVSATTPVLTADITALLGNITIVSAGSTVTLNVPSTYATIQAAFSAISNWIILGTVIIQVADGTYTLTSGINTNHVYGERIRLLGNVTTASNVVLQVTGLPTFDVIVCSAGHTLGFIDGFRINATTKGILSNNFTGILAVQNATINTGTHIEVNNFYYGIAARDGSYIYCPSAIVTNAGDVGIWAYSGSTVVCTNAQSNNASDTTNNYGFGFQAEFGSTLVGTGASATGNYIAGIAALSNSTVRVHDSVTTANTGAGYYSKAGGVIEAVNGTTTNNGTYGIEVHENGYVQFVTTNTGNTIAASNNFAYLSDVSGQAQLAASTGALRVDAVGNTFFNHANGLNFQINDGASGLNSRFAASGQVARALLQASGTPTNIDADIESKGNGVVRLRSNGAPAFQAFNTSASTVNYGQVDGGISGTGVQFGAFGTDSNIDLSLSARGTGVVRLRSNGAPGLQVFNSSSSTVNYGQVNGSATGGAVEFAAFGSDTNVDLLLSARGAGVVRLRSNGVPALQVFNSSASTVNYGQVDGGVSGTGVQFGAFGSDPNIDVVMSAKGSGVARMRSNGQVAFQAFNTSASAANYLQAQGNISGSSPALTAQGPDTNIDVALIPKGTGVVRSGFAAVFGPTTTVGTAFVVSGLSGGDRRLVIQTSSSSRWAVGANIELESGSNAGSNFVIDRHDDSGIRIDSPLVINRANGITQLNSLTTLGTALIGSNLTVNATGGSIVINGAAATARRIAYHTSGSNRWQAGSDGTAESGSNAGSNYVIQRYSDAGGLIDTPLTIFRNTGTVQVTGDLTATTVTASFVGSLTGSASANLPLSGGTLTGPVTGTTFTATTFTGALAGNASTATALATSRNFSVSGDATTSAGVGFTGAANVDLPITLASVGTAGTKGSASSVPVFVTDAKGRVTSNTDTAIAISASQTTSGTFADARIAASNVTQHQAALTVLESQITDGALLARNAGNETITGNWTFNGTTTVAEPTLAGHAATKNYVDNAVSGLDVKQSVRVATTANITLSGTQTIDGVAVIAGNRVLVKDQSAASANGIYVVAAGAWSRSADADNSPAGEVTSGMYTFVEEGSANADSGWLLTTNDPITLGSTSLAFAQFTGTGQISAGAGLTKTGATIDINTASAARIVVNTDNIDLATVTDSGTGTFRKIAVDSYGRVSGTTAVVASDITSLIGASNVTIGSTTIALGGTSTSLAGVSTISMSGQLTSTATTGTAPFVVASTTQVANLNAATAGTSTNVAGGAAGSVHYQTGAGVTAMLAAGTSSQVLVSGTTPSWTNTPTLTGTNFTGIPNAALTNSSVTIGSTNIALGATSAALAGLTSVAATTFVGALTGTASGNLPIAGGTLSGNLAISPSSGDSSLTVNTAASGGLVLVSLKTNNLNRWAVAKDNVAESGSNVGSDFAINRYDDAGAFAGIPLGINRATGLVTIGSLTTSTLAISTSAPSLVLNDSSPSNRTVSVRTANSIRWQWGGNSQAESGSNAGSNFVVDRHNDAGTRIDSPFVINRATGNAVFSANVAATSFSGPLTGNVTGSASLNLLLTGGTLSGNLVVNSTGQLLQLTGAAGTARRIGYQTAGSVRWQVGANGSPESGSNVGTDYIIQRFDDAGAIIDTPVTIFRNTGTVQVTGSLTATTVTASFVGSLTGAASLNVLKTGDTMTGNLTLSSTSPALSVNATTAANQSTINLQQGGSNRWQIIKNNIAESGSNAGSNFVIQRFDDSGAFIDAPFSINRQSGGIAVGGNTSLTASVRVVKNATGGTSVSQVAAVGTTQSDVTTSSVGFITGLSTAAATFTLAGLRHYIAAQSTIGAGSTVTEQIGFLADSSMTGAGSNYGFYSNIAAGTNRWNFFSNGTAQNFFGGNVGIGVTTPSRQLSVGNSTEEVAAGASGGVSTLTLGGNQTSANICTIVQDRPTGNVTINQGTVGGTMTPRFFLEGSTGNIGVGTTLPSTNFHVEGTVLSQRYALPGALVMRQAGGTVAVPTSTAFDSVVGILVSRAYDGSVYRDITSVTSIAAEGTTSTSSSGHLAFSTTPTGSINPLERMRILSTGVVSIGRTGTNNAVAGSSIDTGGGVYLSAPGAGSLNQVSFYRNGSGSTVGTINTTSTGTAYNIASDARLKKDIVDAPSASTLIDSLQVRSFKWNSNDEQHRFGFVAQELHEVVPEAVTVGADVETNPWSVDYSKLVPLLVKEIQELRARIAALEA